MQDTTPPVLLLTTGHLTRTVPTASTTGTSLDLSGIASAIDNADPSVNITHDAPALFPIGSTLVTFTATDDHGNVSTQRLIVQLVYNFGGFLAPIRADGSSIFKAGRVIPIKFQLRAADGSFITNANPTLEVFKLVDSALTTVPMNPAGKSNEANIFRFDPGTNQYIYDLSTNGLSAGTYLLRVVLDDETVHEVHVSIQ